MKLLAKMGMKRHWVLCSFDGLIRVSGLSGGDPWLITFKYRGESNGKSNRQMNIKLGGLQRCIGIKGFVLFFECAERDLLEKKITIIKVLGTEPQCTDPKP